MGAWSAVPPCNMTSKERGSLATQASQLADVPATASVPAATEVKQALPEPDIGYRQPPKEISDIVNEPVQPGLSISPDRKKVMQMYWPAPLPPITELARPELKLAGLRIDPEIAARSRMSYTLALGISDLTDTTVLPAPQDQETRITGYPAGFWLSYVTWSEDSRHIAFAVRSPGRSTDPPRKPLELWVADVATGKSRCILSSPEYGLNGVFHDYLWVDEDTIAALVVPQHRGAAPERPLAPSGPRISTNIQGSVSQARTYQDLLKSAYDEELFEHHAMSDLVYVKVSTGEITQLNDTRMYTAFAPSPNGEFLAVSWMERPFSYNVPCGRFPKRVQVWDRQGNVVREVAALPLAEDIPITFNSTRKGPRNIEWRADKPAELCWIECQDGGNPAVEVLPRDIVYTLPMHGVDPSSNGATHQPRVLATTDMRCGGVAWGSDDLALLYESWWKTRRSKVWSLRPGDPSEDKRILFERNYEDAYSNPGSPANRRNSLGQYVLAMVDGERKLLLQGPGASQEGSDKGCGNRPFLDLLDVDTGTTKRLWQSSPPFLESSGTLLVYPDDTVRLEGLQLLITRETQDDQAQFYIKTLTAEGAEVQERQLSRFPHPHPTLKGTSKEILRYKRGDGVDLTATLYTPPGYDRERDGPLPCILWAYPREYKSKDAAGQLTRSPYRFNSIGSQSPLLWLSRKYAVLDGPTMPIIAEGDEEPNDTYVEQLTQSARAAIEEAVRQGVADPKRIAVGGHSYGAFMAANLLAHAPDLFACGIAKSGAYNRTLTPFGFQAEERTIWQAPDTYQQMSPFMQANKIKQPLLLIHGEDDDNSGTFPLQSERLYAALKGHGAPARLVLLPHESHGYRARESVLHALYEMDAWLEAWCGADVTSKM
ncbi:hypothetical protein WJX73_010840 [Symbiochloris irregularis]|uniref:Probable glutamyl endopeptidase, chloroplastic n=1 Tax=Symbiochloris irregularis TaxID=706552 RepID=A0AAW1PAS3_9CHLO